MATIQQLAAKMNRNVAEQLIRNAQAMPPEKALWSPLDLGRSALSQVAECAVIAGFSVQTLSARAVPPFDPAEFGAMMAQFDTLDKAIEALQASTERLVEAIEAFPSEELDTLVTMPYASEPMSWAEVMLGGHYWNTVYHIGQIAYIQTLYGDAKMY